MSAHEALYHFCRAHDPDRRGRRRLRRDDHRTDTGTDKGSDNGNDKGADTEARYGDNRREERVKVGRELPESHVILPIRVDRSAGV